MVSPAGTEISSAEAATISRTRSGTSLKRIAFFNAPTTVSMESLQSPGGRRWQRRAVVLRLFLLLPASAEGAVEEDDGSELVALGACEPELRIEELPLGVEHLEVARDPALVALEGEPRGDADRRHLIGVGGPRFTGLLDADRRVGHLLQRLLDGLAVGRNRLIEHGPRRFLGGGQPAALEEGSEETRAYASRERVRPELRERRGFQTDESRERQRRQPIRDGDSHPVPGCDHALLRGDHVGTALEELGRDAERDVGGQGGIGEQESAGNRTGRSPEEHAELVLLHRD